MNRARMSKEQLNYAIAKAKYDAILSKVQPERDINNARKDQTIEQWSENSLNIEYKYGFWDALNELGIAEQAMIAWCQDTMQKHHPNDYNKVKIAFEEPIYNQDLRQKLINLCFKLSV